MNIRKAEEKDIPRLLALLGQVLQIHAEIRPDIFIPGTTKYTVCELAELLKQEDKPIYVAVNEEDVCMGYAFCQLKKQPFSIMKLGSSTQFMGRSVPASSHCSAMMPFMDGVVPV